MFFYFIHCLQAYGKFYVFYLKKYKVWDYLFKTQALYKHITQ